MNRRKANPCDFTPGRSLHVELTAVPAEGLLTVVFLGEYEGILTHRLKSQSVACPGESLCPTSNHRARSVWKGYAPVEMWRGAPHLDWAPTVLEITEHLEELLRCRGLRGEVWSLKRHVNRHGKNEVTGSHVETRPEDTLRAAFSIEPVVYRIYRTTDIHWGVRPIMPPRQILEPSKAPPPPSERNGTKAAEKPLTEAEIHQKMVENGLRPQGQTLEEYKASRRPQR